MMKCQQAIRLWKLNPVYEDIFSNGLDVEGQNNDSEIKYEKYFTLGHWLSEATSNATQWCIMWCKL